MVNLDDYVMTGNIEKFKTELLKGITERPAYCVEIMERAFGKDYSISKVLSRALSDMYETAISKLLEEGEINEFDKFKNNEGKYSVFTTRYVRAKK